MPVTVEAKRSATRTHRPHAASRRAASPKAGHATEAPLPKVDAHRVLQSSSTKSTSMKAAVNAIGARTWTPSPTAPRLAPVSILDVRPNVDGGDFALKRVQGESLRVRADILKEGHDQIRANLVVKAPDGTESKHEMSYDYNNDEWHADVTFDQIGRYTYSVESFTDHFGTWAEGLARKVGAGRDVKSEMLEGEAMLRAAAKNASGKDRAGLLNAALVLSDAFTAQPERAKIVDDALVSLMKKYESADDLSTSHRDFPIVVERGRAKTGAWYEMFPRSATKSAKKHGTLREAEQRLSDIRSMGFDVVYLPPIHPIGEMARKGKNNAETAAKSDVGSPWAIGSRFGGHDAINPALGDVDDFVHFVKAANDLGMEVALDFAVQCAPDHPWVKEHPDWFKHRPDGTIQYGENPPKVYQDIVQLDMWGPKRAEIWEACKDVMDKWIDRGVKIFRVDNPHTKPPAFWQWLIESVQKEHPDVVFLSEAFARPKKQELYTKLGFSQSYTYFTWKNSRSELESFMKDVVDSADYFRPNFFANTPDILPEYLQSGGRAAFEVRYALAATMSPSVGIYSGFELCENEALKGEDYLDSEKYEIKPRDYDAPGNIKEWIAKVNYIAHGNPALQHLTNFRLHNADNDQILSFSKSTPNGDNKILVVANLDAHNAQSATLHLDGPPLGLGDGSKYVVHDLITDKKYEWNGLSNFVKLDPSENPVHIFRIEGA
jgi:starch synthase (maltosyl-transferring)